MNTPTFDFEFDLDGDDVRDAIRYTLLEHEASPEGVHELLEDEDPIEVLKELCKDDEERLEEYKREIATELKDGLSVQKTGLYSARAYYESPESVATETVSVENVDTSGVIADDSSENSDSAIGHEWSGKCRTATIQLTEDDADDEDEETVYTYGCPRTDGDDDPCSGTVETTKDYGESLYVECPDCEEDVLMEYVGEK